MIFNSIDFAIFFVIVFCLYFILRRHLLLQNRLLLVASSVFYGWWDWRFLLLMYFTIVVDHTISKYMEVENHQAKRKRLLQLSIFTNLGILCIFKYLGFFVESATELMTMLGWRADPFLLGIILPVGISFYTFQSMSYIIDVYYKKLKPSNSVFDYATYVSLFPQLVAGPIERGTHLLPQVLKPRKITWDGFNEGIYLILWGLFKKLFKNQGNS